VNFDITYQLLIRYCSKIRV